MVGTTFLRSVLVMVAAFFRSRLGMGLGLNGVLAISWAVFVSVSFGGKGGTRTSPPSSQGSSRANYTDEC
eukprot:5607976-Pyramimonas_sp.AAC.1